MCELNRDTSNAPSSTSRFPKEWTPVCAALAIAPVLRIMPIPVVFQPITSSLISFLSKWYSASPRASALHHHHHSRGAFAAETRTRAVLGTGPWFIQE